MSQGLTSSTAVTSMSQGLTSSTAVTSMSQGLTSSTTGTKISQGLTSSTAGTKISQGLTSSTAGTKISQGLTSSTAGTKISQGLTSSTAGTRISQGLTSSTAGTRISQGLTSSTAGTSMSQGLTSNTTGTSKGLHTSQTSQRMSDRTTEVKSEATTTKGSPTPRVTRSDATPSGNGSDPTPPPLVKIHISKDKVLPAAFSHSLVVTFIVVYIFIIFLAFFGNLLVIFVITWARMVRSFTDLFIVSLAVSDILISTINMPIQLNLIVINEWSMGDFFCKFTHYLQAVTIVANILTLTVIAIDRYLVICHSEVSRKVRTKRFAILALVIVWFVSLCVVSPQLIVQRIEPRIKIDFNNFDILGISHVCVENFPKPEKYDRKIFSLTIFVGVYLVPVFVMAFTYGAIAHRLWVQQPIGDILANPRNHARSIKQKRKVIKMLILLVVAFTVLWFPFFTASLYQEFVKTDSTFRITLVILQLVGYSNCCFNPIIYTFLNKKFQVEFKRIFCVRWRRIVTSIQIIERRSHSNPQSGHSNPHSVHSNPHSINSNPHSMNSNPHSIHSNPHSSSHNDVIVQGLNKTDACSHI
ncbi:QRFP-like peptide receptor [Gigantopelta aegis]|uniref:QRFP-like peptide receptor n=1 Tax=Gigantopelta aegis TaxID=1735272 RepID=UPI001B88A2DC|nr:QRFP-like peptide receptor [Gigantopelta aegis]